MVGKNFSFPNSIRNYSFLMWTWIQYIAKIFFVLFVVFSRIHQWSNCGGSFSRPPLACKQGKNRVLQSQATWQYCGQEICHEWQEISVTIHAFVIVESWLSDIKWNKSFFLQKIKTCEKNLFPVTSIYFVTRFLIHVKRS